MSLRFRFTEITIRNDHCSTLVWLFTSAGSEMQLFPVTDRVEAGRCPSCMHVLLLLPLTQYTCIYDFGRGLTCLLQVEAIHLRALPARICSCVRNCTRILDIIGFQVVATKWITCDGLARRQMAPLPATTTRAHYV